MVQVSKHVRPQQVCGLVRLQERLEGQDVRARQPRQPLPASVMLTAQQGDVKPAYSRIDGKHRITQKAFTLTARKLSPRL